MFNLFVLNESFSIPGQDNLTHNLLNIISAISVTCGIFVILTKNPIVSVLFLIGLFLTIACYLIILGISFIGLSYLLVYVGAVSILFLFILMLINVRVSELSTDNSNSIPLAIITGVIFNLFFYNMLPSNYSAISYDKESQWSNFSSLIGASNIIDKKEGGYIQFVTSHTWDGVLAETSHITSIGNIIYTSYPLLLLITSIILLLSMVGAIVITIKQ